MDNFIFIIGCGHSGTTIMNKIVSNHKYIYGLEYETAIFNNNNIIIELKKLKKNRDESHKKWICEKTPTHIYQIDKMYKYTINPKIIVMIRDGRDVVSSLYKRYNDFNKSINRWINDNEVWINSEHKNDFHILKYEDFIANPQLELEKICAYLGEEYDDNMLNYKKENIILPENIFDNKIDGKDHSLLRLHQINKDIYDGTKRYLTDLTEEQLNLLYSNERFMNLMKLFNYL
jgi:hypothetical protein